MDPKIIFFGNTKYSTIGFQLVNKSYPISLVVTIPGSPVENLARELKLPVLITEKLDQSAAKKISEFKPDFLLVEDYGLILPKEVLNIPRYAPLNIHHSLLPKYRGSSPAPAAILNGDKVSGVTIIKMVREVDAGDILAQEKYELSDDETADSLLTKLNELGGELAVKVIKQHLEGIAEPSPQNHSQASYTDHFTRQTGYFEIDNPPDPQILDRMTRAYYPWPGVWTKWNGKIVKFLPNVTLSKAKGINPNLYSSPSAQNDRFLIQMEGKKPVSFRDFINGYPDFPIRQLQRG